MSDIHTNPEPSSCVSAGSAGPGECLVELFEAIDDMKSDADMLPLTSALMRNHVLVETGESLEIGCGNCPVIGTVIEIGGHSLQSIVDRSMCPKQQ